MDPKRLKSYFEQNKEAMLRDVQAWVEMESPTHDKSMVDLLGNRLRERFEALGCRVTVMRNNKFGDHLLVEQAGASGNSSRYGLVLCHFDTVWPVGTLSKMPFSIDDGRATGPGVFDMKTSLVMIEYALRASEELAYPFPRPIKFLLTTDEEIGSPTSRQHIEKTAAGAEYVLVPEPPFPDGKLKTKRKGIGHFLMSIKGRPSHSGLEPEKGRSAIVELAHQILYLNSLNEIPSGTTVNVGIIRGGTMTNVVAAEAEASIDARAWTVVEAQRLESAILNAKPVTQDVTINVTGAINRLPMERTPGNRKLFEQARKMANKLGFHLEEGAAGGGSDGNITSALGIPTLDGLGAVGDGPHAPHENIRVDSVPMRAALIAGILLSN